MRLPCSCNSLMHEILCVDPARCCFSLGVCSGFTLNARASSPQQIISSISLHACRRTVSHVIVLNITNISPDGGATVFRTCSLIGWPSLACLQAFGGTLILDQDRLDDRGSTTAVDSGASSLSLFVLGTGWRSLLQQQQQQRMPPLPRRR